MSSTHCFISTCAADAIETMSRCICSQDSHGHRKIARALNADPSLVDINQRYFGGRRVPPLRKGSGSWAPGCVRAILLNEIYCGQIVWDVIATPTVEAGPVDEWHKIQPRG
jgi:Recombinase